MAKTHEEVRRAIDALDQQRRNALEVIKKKAAKLLDNENLNVEGLGSPVTVDFARDVIQVINNVLLATEAHSGLLDAVISDLSYSLKQSAVMQDLLMRLSTVSEGARKVLMDKAIITETELDQAIKELQKEAEESAKIARNEMIRKAIKDQGPGILT